MRRVLRITVNAATVVSLVLCVATVAMWLRSFRVADTLTFNGSTGQILASGNGELGLVLKRWIPLSNPLYTRWTAPIPDASAFVDFQCIGGLYKESFRVELCGVRLRYGNIATAGFYIVAVISY